MKRKLLAMGLAVAMVLSVSACGKEDVSSDTVQTGEQTVERDSAEESSVSGESTEEATSVDIAELDMSEYVTLNQYDGMTVQVNKTEVTDENTEYYINNFILSSYPVTDRAVATGDVVLIDYVGKKDGVAFEGGSYEGYELEIGSGTFIPGFEDGLVGVMPGTTVDLNITFPENYSNSPELAGQPVVFTVTVHSISAAAEYATVTPEQMAAMGLTYQSKDELWEAGKQLLTEELDYAYESNVKGAIFTKLYEESQVTTAPAYLVEEELNGSMAYMEMICMAYYQCDLETYVTAMYGMTVDEFKEQMRTTAEETVKQYLVIEATAKDMGIELTEEEFMAVAEADAAAGGYASVEEYLNEAGRTAIRATLLYDKVMEELLKCVVVEDIVAE